MHRESFPEAFHIGSGFVQGICECCTRRRVEFVVCVLMMRV
jgi:hypothetical protein